MRLGGVAGGAGEGVGSDGGRGCCRGVRRRPGRGGSSRLCKSQVVAPAAGRDDQPGRCPRRTTPAGSPAARRCGDRLSWSDIHAHHPGIPLDLVVVSVHRPLDRCGCPACRGLNWVACCVVMTITLVSARPACFSIPDRSQGGWLCCLVWWQGVETGGLEWWASTAPGPCLGHGAGVDRPTGGARYRRMFTGLEPLGSDYRRPRHAGGGGGCDAAAKARLWPSGDRPRPGGSWPFFDVMLASPRTARRSTAASIRRR